MSNKIYFLWVKINGKFWPEKKYNDYQSKLRYVLENIVFKKELANDEENLTLDQLVVKFPAPKLENENDQIW